MDTDALVVQLIDHEGIRLKPYTDTVGKLTIGVGRNLTDRGISQAEAEILLGHDIAEVEGRLDLNLPWWRQLSEIRQRVLADMCFNMGIGTLLGFSNMLSALASARYDDAAQSMRASHWADQVGKRAERLARMMEDNREVSLREVT